MDTKIQYVVKESGERVYFKDSEATEIIENTKQKKITAGRGLKLVGNKLSLADDISGGSSLKYFTIDGLLSSSSYDGVETELIEGSTYSKFSVQFTYLGNPQIFINYASQSSHEYATLRFINELSSSIETNVQKAVEAISNLEATNDDYFCLIPVIVISGEFSREIKGYNSDGNLEACSFADWYIDYYGERQQLGEIQGSIDSSSIIQFVWKHLAG